MNVYTSTYTDIILTPTLLSRQGFLMDAEWVQRFDAGSFRIKGSGLYQFDRDAFIDTVGDRDWRGALQTSGDFTPIKDWTGRLVLYRLHRLRLFRGLPDFERGNPRPTKSMRRI